MPYGYDPRTHSPEGWVRMAPRRPAPAAPVDPLTVAVERRDFAVLLWQARGGDKIAEAELRLRGNSMTREG